MESMEHVHAHGPGRVSDGGADRLTPAAVHHQVFTVVRLREGYDLAEVDAFLARVEAGLALLWEDNARLREQLTAGPVAAHERAGRILVEAQARALAVEDEAQARARAVEDEARVRARALEDEAQARGQAVEDEARARARTVEDRAQQSANALLERAGAAYRQSAEFHLDQLARLAAAHGGHLPDGLAGHLAELRRLLDGTQGRDAAAGPAGHPQHSPVA